MLPAFHPLVQADEQRTFCVVQGVLKLLDVSSSNKPSDIAHHDSVQLVCVPENASACWRLVHNASQMAVKDQIDCWECMYGSIDEGLVPAPS